MPSTRAVRRPLRPLAFVLAWSACTGDRPLPTTFDPVELAQAEVSTNVHNVLSARVTVTVRHADSVVVRLRATGDAEEASASAPAEDGPATIPILGLRAATHYDVVIDAHGRHGSVASDTLELSTGALPPDLPAFSASGTDTLPGFVVFSSGGYGLVIDNSGRVVWYRKVDPAPGLAFLPQPNGRYATRPPTPAAGDIEPWVEFDAWGDVTRSLTCARGLQPRLHDFIALPGGDYWLMCDETRTMDLTTVGGVAGALVTGTVIQHLSATHELLFEWNAFDHFSLSDLPLDQRAGPVVNWTHGNSIDLDAHGNVFASFRNLNEITKIDGGTGQVVWRFGGLRNQFTLLSGARFAGQHGVRAIGNDAFVLLDNIGDVAESRMERWQLDRTTGAARLIRSAGAIPVAQTLIGGSVQPLPQERTLVAYGTSGRLEEYDRFGAVAWRLLGHAGYVFRAQRIESLYQPGAGAPR